MQDEKELMHCVLESVVETLSKDFIERGVPPGDLVDAAISGIGRAWRVKADDFIKQKLGH